MPEMIVRIGADVQAAVSGINQVADKMNALPGKIAPGTASIDRFNERLRSTAPAGQSFGKGVDAAAAKMAKMPAVTNTASQSLINFSRVAQDAPFGILGIANNLNPLFESLQRTSAAAKEAGTSLGSALKGALTGPAGIGLAIGVVSSLLITFQGALGGTVVSFSKAEIAAAAFSQSLKDVGDRLDEMRSKLDFENEISNLQAQLSNLRGPNLDFAKSINSVNRYIQEIAGIDKELTPLKQKQSDLKKEIDGVNAAFNKFSTEGGTSIKQFVKSVAGQGNELQRLIKEFGSPDKIPDKLIEKLDKDGQGVVTKYKQVTEEIKKLSDERLNALRESGKASIGGLVTINDAKLDEIEKKLKVKPKKVDIDFQSTLFIPQNLKNKVSIPSPFTVLLTDLQKVLVSGEAKETIQEEAERVINEQIGQLVLKIKLPTIKLNKPTPDQIKAKKFVDAIDEAINSGLANISTDGITSIADTIGEAFSGGDIKDAFKAFGNAIGGGLQAIGKQIISIGVAALLAKKALAKLFTNPAIAIAAGVALVAAGAALKNVVTGGLKARKKGGPVKPGEPYLVGEEGPEIVTFKQSGFVIPNGKTNKILAGARQFGGSVVSGLSYLAGEAGREMYVPFASSSLSRNKPTGLAGSALSTIPAVQYIPMIKNGELGLLIKRNEKYLGRNT